jgi:hypothetical protein
MRTDMHKVIVEEPRGGGGKTKNWRRANLPDELLPKHEGIRRLHRHQKRFGEHLSPLKRWLRSNCGRLWNQVYSEAAQVIKASDPVRLHIKFHMMQMVERNTFMLDGKIYCYRNMETVDLGELSSHPVWPTFFVHPESGLLFELPQRKRRVRHTGRSDERWLTRYRLLKKLRGLLFECEWLPFPQQFDVGERALRYDMIRRQWIGPLHGYGEQMFCIRKRQLSKKELRAYGLSNSGNESEAVDGTNRIQQYLACEILLSPVASGSQCFFAARLVFHVPLAEQRRRRSAKPQRLVRFQHGTFQ